MKNLRIITAITLLSIVYSCEKHPQNDEKKYIPCLPTSLTANVLAFYPFSNGTVNDLSGNQNHLVNTTTAKSTSDRNGNDSCAYEFVNLPNSTEFLTTSATNFLNGFTTIRKFKILKMSKKSLIFGFD